MNTSASAGAQLRASDPTRGKPGLLADAEPEDSDGARPRAADRFQVYPGEARGREADAVAEQYRQYIHQDLVDEPSPQALAGHVGAEDLQVLAARSVQCRGDGFPDVTSEERDLWVRRVRRRGRFRRSMLTPAPCRRPSCCLPRRSAGR